MKKILLVLGAVLVCSSANAAVSDSDWKFESTLGPVIDIKDWGGTQFGMNFKIGKGDGLSGLFGMAFGGINDAQFKIGAAYDIPFYFTFSKAKDFSVGPTFDAGMRFGFGGVGTMIDFLNLGFGCRTTYQISDSFGVVADLVHFSMSFVGWAKGAGVDSNFAMAYDMQFGIFYLF